MALPQKTTPLPTLRRRLTLLGFGSAAISILVCVVFLLLLIIKVTAPFVESDLDFALQETGNSLATKTQLLTDALLEIRREPVLMDALNGGGLLSKTDADDSPTEALLRRTVDIYSAKNTAYDNEPFLKAVYLFDRSGTYNRVCYRDMLYQLQQISDKQFEGFYQRFQASKQEAAAFVAGDYLVVAHTLYNSAMQPCGTLVFSIRTQTVQLVMGKTAEYEDSFWCLLDKKNAPLMAGGEVQLASNDIAQLSAQVPNQPYVQRLFGTNYRIRSHAMGMGLTLVQGISSNQMVLLLFDSIKYYALGLVLALLLLGAVLFLLIVRNTRPLEEISKKLELVAQKQFDTKLPEYDVQEYAAIASTFNAMTDMMNYLIHDVYEKKLLVMNTEMKFLQSQMNPHFLYNVLNTIALKARMDGNLEVSTMASNFSYLTQARMSHKDDEKVTLAQEMQYVRFYLDLQKSRYEDKLNYSISIQEEGLLCYFIPKLTIELLVENAVLHGIERKKDAGHIYVQVYRGEKGIEILVEDDGAGFEGRDGHIALPLPEKHAESDHNHIALNNVSKLIGYYYGDEYGINIQSRAQVGTVVIVSIPYDKEGNHVPSDFGG